MSYIASCQTLYINSYDRLEGDSSNFKVKKDIKGDYEFCVCKSISIPKTFYLIQEGQNTFQLSENGTVVDIQMPAKNYDELKFETELETQLNDNSPNGYLYTVKFNEDIGKYVFTVANNNNVQPIIIISENMNEQFGFNENSQNTFVDNELTSSNVINMQRETTLQLRSDMVGTNSGDNILQSVFRNGSPDYTSITYECTDIQANSKQFKGNNNNIFQFYLTDENGTPVYLNGNNFCVEILLWKKDNVNDVVKRFLTIVLANAQV